MKKTITTIVSMLMALSFVFAVSMPLYANIEEYGTNSLGLGMDDLVNQSTITIVNDKGLQVDVDIEPNAVGKITIAEVLDTANAVYEVGQKITIHNIGYSRAYSRDSVISFDDIRGYTDPYVYPECGVNRVAKDVFIVSVAKGQIFTFNEPWAESYTLEILKGVDPSLSISETLLKIDLGLLSTYSTTYTASTSTTFQGPPESSEYNSREYRIKFYHRARNFRVTVNGEREYGMFWEPRHYAVYSIDKTVS